MPLEWSLRKTVYTPESELFDVRGLLRDIWHDFLTSRELAWRLLTRNISAQYRQSFLGYFWAFVPPLFTTLVWVFLNSQRILDVGDTGMPYPLFVLTGSVLWQLFAEALESPLKFVGDSKSMLTKINFPREALILASVGQVIFNFLIRLALLVLVFAVYATLPPLTVLLVPLALIAMVLFGVAIGILLTPLGILYQDVGRAITVGIQAWFFLTPVVYPMPPASWAQTLLALNPVTPLLLTARDWMINGETTHLVPFLLVTGGSLVMLAIGLVFYRIAMPHLIARMNA